MLFRYLQVTGSRESKERIQEPEKSNVVLNKAKWLPSGSIILAPDSLMMLYGKLKLPSTEHLKWDIGKAKEVDSKPAAQNYEATVIKT